ncbi:hypothetical protein TeGR_g2985, partial [Tetraparma gracilis]
CKLGLSNHSSTEPVDWFDMCGTLSYLTGRHPSFSSAEYGGGRLWTTYLAVSQFVYYVVAGKACRTVMRGELQGSTLSFFLRFCMTGFLPVQIFQAFRDTLNDHDPHQLMVCAYWGLTKLRSIHRIAEEALHTHAYSPIAAVAVGVLSWEVAAVMSKVEQGVLKSGPRGAMGALAGGAGKWLRSRGLKISVLISVILTYRHSVGENAKALDFVLYPLCFYRYSHGLLETVAGRVYSGLRREKAKGD